MSASLVGSEMCIRDSPAPSIPAFIGIFGICTKDRAECAPGEPWVSMLRPCLLYTSDAADDM
eukprot:6788952-Alexandrium_andersonii.AAC.1